MGFVLAFIKRNSFLMTTLVLLIVSFILTTQRNVYQNSQWNELALSLRAGIDSKVNAIWAYINLPETNNDLMQENKKLKEILFNKKNVSLNYITQYSDSLRYYQKYELIQANVISNSVSSMDNYFIINKGTKAGIKQDMGIISTNGIVGIITKSTANYASGISILHSKTRINARIKNKDYFGYITWKGDDTRLVHLVDIPKFVHFEIGDTIETDGKSNLFPEGINIGRIADGKLDNISGNWDIYVELFQNMSKITSVFAVKNLHKVELQQVQPENTLPEDAQ